MASQFLQTENSQSWHSERVGAEFELYTGKGSRFTLEIIVATNKESPTKKFLTDAYTDRRDGRVNPVLVIVPQENTDSVSLCGVSGENPPVYRDVDVNQTKRVCTTAVDKQNRNSAERFLNQTLQELSQDFAGINNQGLLATHELKNGVPKRSDWEPAQRKAEDIMSDDAEELVNNLGYKKDELTDQSYILKSETKDKEQAVAVFLDETESYDHSQERFVGDTPISYALDQAEKRNLEFVIAARNDGTIRLYTTNPDLGFGSRGRTNTYVELNTSVISNEQLGYLWLLYSSEALKENGSFHEILDDSQDYAAAVSDRLRERIYDDVVPDLATGLADARNLSNPTREELDETYEMALFTLYRLLFVAYAEDERFLPRRRNERYDDISLQGLVHDIQDFYEDGGQFSSKHTDYWDRVHRLFGYINKGHSEYSLPEYNGRLLSTSPEKSPTGAQLDNIQLTNDEFAPVLYNLFVDETQDGEQGVIDFRDIGVREFGEIYEGLLESELSYTDEPLKIDQNDKYVPVDSDTEDTNQIEIESETVYLHGKSGERKSTGSFYTKTRFVEHLLDYSLNPAIEKHLNRIDEIRDNKGENAAAESFFDFRVADIAMGSGHFLISAVDRVAKEFYTYLKNNPLPAVDQELNQLEEQANQQLENSGAYSRKIDREQLLRRQVARRCIYGVDLNSLATELSRLSVWVHTFVPGLPLTFLDYNLVTGDALAGIGTIDEVTELLDAEQTSIDMFTGGKGVMHEIREDINQLGKFADASAEQVREARDTREEIQEKLTEVEARFDVLSASRIDEDINTDAVSDAEIDITTKDCYGRAQELLEGINPLHFPTSFPEVFDGDKSGFDVVIGNPPWEEELLDEDNFWGRYEPRLKGKSKKEKERKINQLKDSHPELVEKYNKETIEKEKRRDILTSGPYPGMGTGDPDTYKAFAWRFWNLIDENGKMGIVLPRSAFLSAGTEEFRKKVLNEGNISDLTFLKNKQGWVFDEAEHRYTMALFACSRSSHNTDEVVPMRGPYPNQESYEEGMNNEPHKFSIEDARNWTGTSSFPLLPENPQSVSVFEQMCAFSSLGDHQQGSWSARPHTELHATNDQETNDGETLMHFIDDPPEEYWPIYKGNSFNLWENDTGVRYAWADPDTMLDYLQESRENSYKYAGSNSAFSKFSEEWVYNPDTLPSLSPRIAFRNVTNRTNQRTVICSLVPPETILTNAAPYFVWPQGNEKDQAYLLGILSSIPLDWYARRFVEANMNYHILNSFPIPRVNDNSHVKQRIVQLSGRLAAVDERYSEWANRVGVEYGELPEEAKQEKIYELDAVVAHLYGLEREHVKVIFETFHDNWDYEERLNKVLKYYDAWSEELEKDNPSVPEVGKTHEGV